MAQEDGKDRCVQAARDLSRAFALAVPHEDALRIRDDVGFFQAVQAVLAKSAPSSAKSKEDMDHAVRQIISQAVGFRGGNGHLCCGWTRESRTSRCCQTSSWPR